MRSIMIILILLAGMTSKITAQKAYLNEGELQYRIIDAQSRKPINHAHVKGILTSDSNIYQQVTSDSYGDIIMKLKPGLYDIMFSHEGYQSLMITQVKIDSGLYYTRDIALTPVVMSPATCTIMRKKPLLALPERRPNQVAPTTPGVDSRQPNIRGARAEGTAYYIDGVRTGSQNTTTSKPGEQYGKITENATTQVATHPLSTFSIDVDRAAYANVRRYLNDGMLPPADAVRVEEMINYFSYDVGQHNTEHPFAINSEVADMPWDKTKKLIRITLKAPDISFDLAPANNLTFLIDVSGSMSDQNKLPLLKNSMRLMIERLRPQDQVSMVVYAGAAGIVLEPTPGKDKEKILNALDQLSAGGSTAGGQGIELAYQVALKHFIRNGNNRVILATDGDFNVGVSDLESLRKMIEEKRKSNVYLSVLGFGTGNIQDEIMETLADKGNGNYNYIDGILEGKKVLVNEMGGTLLTVANDVKIQVEFNPKYVASYKLLGYENRMLNTEDFADDKKDAGEIGAGHCVTAIYEITINSEAATASNTLKYQQPVLTHDGNGTEMMNIKVRYKTPGAEISKAFEVPVQYQDKNFKESSGEMKFAVAVALFGMKLRQSPALSKVSYNDIIAMGRSGKGNDEHGYRGEFIRLVETAELLTIRSN